MKASSLVSNRLLNSDPKYGTDAFGVNSGGVTPPFLLGVPPLAEKLRPSPCPPVGVVAPPLVCIIRHGVRAPVLGGVLAPLGIVSSGGPGIEGGGPRGGWLGIESISGTKGAPGGPRGSLITTGVRVPV